MPPTTHVGECENAIACNTVFIAFGKAFACNTVFIACGNAFTICALVDISITLTISRNWRMEIKIFQDFGCKQQDIPFTWDCVPCHSDIE